MANNKSFKVKNGLELEAYSKAISDTAVDIFVYDTSKDSDGGAWRKRTQGTSWYNETLNTATRGSRKEFPAVAVIVAESNQVTIYDGDDPDLPMWMVFNASQAGDLISGGSGTVGSLAAINGIVCVGQPTSGSSSAGGVKIIDFVKDRATQHSNKSTGSGIGYFRSYIADREDYVGYGAEIGTAGRIVSINVNDVAMTVLPNAPIDAATGLPVPTIAVATNGGVSVIKDDGTVVSSNHAYGGSIRISITPDGLLYATHNGPTSGQALEVIDLLSLKGLNNLNGNNAPFHGTNTIGGQHRYYGFGANLNTTSHNMPFLLPSWGQTAAHAVTKDHFALGGDGSNFGISNSGEHKSLIRIAEEPSNPANGMVNLTNTTYNTGWMNGDIKLATLSDTDDTDVTGTELVTNGTFDSNTTGWTVAGSGASAAVSSGQLVLTRVGNTSNITQYITTVVGQAYTLSFDFTAASGGARMYATLSGLSTITATATTGSYSITAVATSTSTYVQFQIWNTTNGTITLDNVSVRLAVEDRSVNGNGLQVFGTVTKNPVATGADLVAYSGFSASNYLQQPYNADFDFGTGDFTYAVWFYIDSDTTHGNFIFSRRQDSGGNGFALYVGGAGDHTIRFQTSDGTASTIASTQTVKSGQWNLIVASRMNATKLQISVNGQQPEYLDTESRNVNVANGTPLHVGINYNLSATSSVEGSIALARISTTVPSPEQIAKIYNDEKHLFQENAQATLYGSSDAVTALAYDDSTNLLHVGTSAGRSDFQGLRRINNTTTAVGSAISASNGLIADD